VNKYESIFIVNPEVGEEKRKEVIDKIKTIITSGGGKLLGLDEWGIRRLSYPVKGCKEGYYCLLNLEANPLVIENLEKNYRTTEEIIKYLSVRVKERKPKPKKVKPKRYRPRFRQKKEYYERGGRRWQE
jgi:small subunit ribosomal protein S6